MENTDFKAIFLSGQMVDLFVLDPSEDLQTYLTWVNNQDTTKYMGTGLFPSTMSQLRAYIESFNNSNGLLLGIALKETGQHVGNITLHMIDRQNSHGEIGILVGEGVARGKGCGLEAIQLVSHHAFGRMNLNKVCAGMAVDNMASKRVFEKAGFVNEGCLREHFYSDGKYLDCFRYSLLRKEFYMTDDSSKG